MSHARRPRRTKFPVFSQLAGNLASRDGFAQDCLLQRRVCELSVPTSFSRVPVRTQLLNAAGALAVASGMNTVFAGVNLARDEAYRQMIGRGFRSQAQIVTLHRPNAPGLQPARRLRARRLAMTIRSPR
jgi:hypothetical protein